MINTSPTVPSVSPTALASQWLNPTTKQFLKHRLRSMSKDQIIETNDTNIAQEYYRMWLEVPMSNPLQRLIRHPLLTVEDKKKIDDYVFDQQKSQIKTAGLMTGGGIGLYWLFLSRNSFFQNFFNNKERRPIFNIGRKVLGVYLVFLGSMMIMNSHYEKKIPNGLNEMGMFRKYRVSFQEKFV